MSPEIIKNKVERIYEYLRVLKKYQNITYEDFLTDKHFTIERIFELLVTTSSDILMHKLALEQESLPTTTRAIFLRAGELKWLPQDLAKKLADAAAMRNLLVHGYEKVDLKIIFQSMKPALHDYAEFCEWMLKTVKNEL